MSLLHRISLSTKFIVLGVIALIMIAVPTGLYFKSLSSEISLAQREAAAKDAVVTLNAVVQFVQTHRGLAAGALNGNEALAQRRPAMRDKVAQNIDLLDTELKGLAIAGEAAALWSDIRQHWGSLEQGVGSKSLSSPESTKLHTQLVAKVLTLNEYLLAQSGMALDPDADTFFLIQASLVNMPWLGENLGIMRAQGTGFLAKQELPPRRPGRAGHHRQART